MENLNIYYDEEGDFLEITNGDISNCYFDNFGNGIFQIIDKETKEVKGIAIHMPFTSFPSSKTIPNSGLFWNHLSNIFDVTGLSVG